MTVIWTGFGGIALACMAAGFVVGMLAERWHRERLKFDAEIDGYEKRLRQNRAEHGRHRMSQPRADLPLQPAAVTPDPKPGPVTLPRGGAIGVFLAGNYRAARGVDTVLLAPQPSPHLTGAADTGTLAKVSITSTGDMPVLTDSFIADLEMREAAYRKEHAESEA